jgi:hypothetical protein
MKFEITNWQGTVLDFFGMAAAPVMVVFYRLISGLR